MDVCVSTLFFLLTYRNSQWTDILAVPFLGAAYFIHWRYRRYAPRRIPTLTSLRLAELYASAGAAWLVFREEDRLERKMMQDRDLMTIEAYALAWRIAYNRTLKSQLQPIPDHLKANEARFREYLSSSGKSPTH